MNFDLALEKVVDIYGRDILKDAFSLRSVVLDYIGNDFYSKRLASTLFLIYDYEDIYNLLILNSLIEARIILKNKFDVNYKGKCTKKEYIDAINAFSKVMVPSQYKVLEAKKELNKKALIEKVNQINKKNQPEQDPLYFHTVNIKVMAYRLTLKLTKSNEVEVYVDGKLKPNFHSKKNVVTNVLSMNLTYPKKEVVVKLPLRQYKLIKIETKDTIIESNDLIEAKSIAIHQDETTSSINANADKLTFHGFSSTLSVSGKINNLIVNGFMTSMKCNLNFDGITESNISFITNYGKAELNMPGIRNIIKCKSKFGRIHTINDYCYIKNCKVTFDVSTKYGYVKV